MPDTTGQYLNDEMLACIEICRDTHKAALQTIPYCLQQGGRHADAVGVVWSEGMLVHEPSAFVEQAEGVNAKQIPGPLWIDVRVEKNDDESLRCFTTGLEPLGFAEIEVPRARLEPQELLEFIGDTACYIVNNNMPIKDGETLGRTAEEKFKVRYGKSMFDRGRVMQIDMP